MNKGIFNFHNFKITNTLEIQDQRKLLIVNKIDR